MNSKNRATRVLVVAATIGAAALSSAAPAGAGACPQSSGGGCERVGPRLDEVRTKVAQQRLRPTPRIAYVRNGQAVWRAGNHHME